MKDLKSILSKILETNPYYTDHRDELLIMERWPEAVGPRVAQHCWPEKLYEDGTLVVASTSNAWLHQLRYLESQILRNLHKTLKRGIVKKLRFKIKGSPQDNFSAIKPKGIFGKK